MMRLWMELVMVVVGMASVSPQSVDAKSAKPVQALPPTPFMLRDLDLSVRATSPTSPNNTYLPILGMWWIDTHVQPGDYCGAKGDPKHNLWVPSGDHECVPFPLIRGGNRTTKIFDRLVSAYMLLSDRKDPNHVYIAYFNHTVCNKDTLAYPGGFEVTPNECGPTSPRTYFILDDHLWVATFVLVNQTFPTRAPTPTPPNADTTFTSTRIEVTWWQILLAVGGLLVIVGGVCAWRARRTKQARAGAGAIHMVDGTGYQPLNAQV